MSIVTVEAYQVPIFGGWAAHTFVAASNQGNPPPDYFACWGQSFTPSPYSPVVTANIVYNRANCYRDPVFGCPDTAAIGIYGVNGVCHQSANCFLFSSGWTLNFSVLGYWASLLLYGTWGTWFPGWLAVVYDICTIINPWAESETPANTSGQPTLVDQIRQIYASPSNQVGQSATHDMIISDSALVTKHFVPESNPAIYRDLHAQLLNEKDALVDSGITGQVLADRLNSLSRQFQAEIAKRVGPTLYKKFNGVDAGQTLNIIDPKLAAITGRPVPPFKHS